MKIREWIQKMDKKTWKIAFIVACVVFAISAAFSGYYIFNMVQEQLTYKRFMEQIALESTPSLEEIQEQDFTSRDGDSPVIPELLYEDDIEQKFIELGIDVSNPIDFEELNRINPDLYAWIRIPDTNIDYPIAQHTEDDSFYLNHNMYKQAQFSGSIYSEAVNSKDFSDPVTILYGHNMKNGSMFQNLHCFEDKEFFDEHPYLFVYTPEGTLVYEVVAAKVTDNKHIMYQYDFEDEGVFEQYLEEMQEISSMSANVREDVELDEESRVLIMSTCVGNDEGARYIVQAVRVYDGREETEEE